MSRVKDFYDGKKEVEKQWDAMDPKRRKVSKETTVVPGFESKYKTSSYINARKSKKIDEGVFITELNSYEGIKPIPTEYYFKRLVYQYIDQMSVEDNFFFPLNFISQYSEDYDLDYLLKSFRINRKVYENYLLKEKELKKAYEKK